MKQIIASIVLVAGLIFSASSMSASMPDIAKQKGCVGCHAIDHKVVGPAWQDVANKYKGNPGAKAKLRAKITKGGSGVWGTTPMPPQQKLTTAEQDELLTFILGLAK